MIFQFLPGDESTWKIQSVLFDKIEGRFVSSEMEGNYKVLGI